MRVIVLGGGASPERDVSIRSARAVSDALIAAGYEVIEKDPKSGLEFLDSLDKDDIVFPILHGAEGEDGGIQSVLEAKGVRYLGTDSSHSKVTFDKNLARQVFIQNGILMPRAEIVTDQSYTDSELAKKPHALKVLRGGSSIGTYLVFDASKIDQQKVADVFALDNEAVIEELIVGTEITVPVLGEEALPVIEIVPPEDGEFDYENKYNGKSQEIVPAVSISAEKQKEAQEIALKAHEVCGCRHLSRTDMIVDANGGIYTLEINTMPGMTDQSLYPKSANVFGLPMPELMKRFVEMVSNS